jgi:sugar O-acyltransferase (sialic acid O-acetyltransferase NeuD family)
LFGLVGAGGHGRSTMPNMADALRRVGLEAVEICFVEPAAGPPVNGWKVMAEADFLADPRPRHFNIAIADSALRARIAARFLAAGAAPVSLAAASASILGPVTIGEGALLSGFATIGANATIGRFFHANLYAYVEHDCVVGDFVTLAPGAKCNGNVHIGDHAFIGAGAILRDGKPGQPLRIGAGAVVGMGAVVIRDVPAGASVVGNPARVLRRG